MSKEIAGKKNTGLAYFFFSFADTNKQKAETCLSTLVYQLCKQISPERIQDYADAITLLEGYSETSSTKELVEVIRLISQVQDRTYIILDALDESEKEPVLNMVRELAESKNKLNIIATSRKEQEIDDALQEIPNIPSLDIQQSVVDADIRLFVSECLDQDPKFKRWPIVTRRKVASELGGRAHGM